MESIFITKWKNEIRMLLGYRYGKLKDDKVETFLDSIIKERLKNPTGYLYNNYNKSVVTSSLLEIIDFSERKNLIMTPAATLFVPHNKDDAPIRDFITDLKKSRSLLKKERGKYPKLTNEWRYYDLAQLNKKLKLNILYGAQGYKGFPLYNVFIAESVTYMGKHIISSAALSFENFITDSVKFNEPAEVYTYIKNILTEYKKEGYKYKLDVICDKIINSGDVLCRLISKIEFPMTNKFKNSLYEILKNCNDNELALLYFKNNLNEFNKQSIILSKLKFLADHLTFLKLPYISEIHDEALEAIVSSLWEFYKIFVFYDYPIYDRVRKTQYAEKSSALYIDTDSNFIGLDPWVRFMKSIASSETMQTVDEETLSISYVNIFTIFLNDVVNNTLLTLAEYMGIEEKYREILSMKNEFMFKYILFTENKKCYISIAIMQEGQLLYNNDNELGLIDVKGLPFKKSTTKSIVNDFYEKITKEEIMQDKIYPERIYKRLAKFQKEIERSMKTGESTYYKQADVQMLEIYKKPYSISGVKSVLIWNALMPDYTIDLPASVDIIPIKDLSKKKNQIWFAEKYPEAYDMIESEILSSDIPEIRGMTLNSIAKPRNNDIPLPEWFTDLIDTDKITMDTLKLFEPVMIAIGTKVVVGTSDKHYYTNIVEL